MPRLGPTKHRDLIAYLRQLGFDGPIPAQDTSSWLKRASACGCPTLIKVISAPDSLAGFCKKLKLAEKSGTRD